MSLPLEDLRSKVSHETHIALDAEAQHRGIDKSELVREILSDWAEARIHSATLLLERLKREAE